MADTARTLSTSSPPASRLDPPPNLSRASTSVAPVDTSVRPAPADFVRPESPRKRHRSSKPSLPGAPTTGSLPATLATKAISSPDHKSNFLTGAAALQDKARIEAGHSSPNPARKALEGLLAPQDSGMSFIQDAPSAPILSGPRPVVAPSIQVPPISLSGDKLQTSPQSTSSSGAIDSAQTNTTNADGASIASPGQMDDASGDGDDDPRSSSARQGDIGSISDEGPSNKAFTFPGPLMAGQVHRTSSLPQSGYGRDNARSPSTKRHKCPYCSTEFTRHHNLKSHLLTHSHEKPYSCDTCEARFRRLHDLKRHTKLHTGERPHVCPKCDRSFARGDALARHNKGGGGCAGRRSSMGSFTGDDKSDGLRAGDGDSMPGIMYTGEASHEPENMDEDVESGGGRSLPRIRKHDAPPDPHYRSGPEHQSMYQSRQPSTYPPVAARQPNSGGLYPPMASPRGVAGNSTAHSSLNNYSPGASASSAFQASGPNVFAQGGMTESPKPLSPAGMASHQLGHADAEGRRNRSPSLTQQFQQQQYGRRTTGHNSPPSMSLPPPPPGLNHSHGPQLPPLSGLNPPDSRFTLHSQSSGPTHIHSGGPNSLPGSQHGPGSPSYPPGGSASTKNSLSSHGTGPHSSIDRPHSSYTQTNDQLWAYIQGLESKMEAKINRLEGEIVSLKTQLSAPQHR